MHARVLRRDAASTAVAFEALYGQLVRRLRARHKLPDPQLAEDAAGRALLEYFDRPERFDPARARLFGYLAMAAERDLLNLIEKERRHQLRVVPIDGVALADLPRNNPVEEAIDEMESTEKSAALRQRAAAAALRDPSDEAVLRLMEERVRATAAYAAALGIGHLPAAEQKRRVKQTKDRLKKRVVRAPSPVGAGR